MFMRLCTSLSLCLAASAALLPAAASAYAIPGTGPGPGPTPSCDTGRGFPLTTRVHGGPAAYQAGGGYGTWFLDLTNRTTRTCTNIHPVIVLVDERRALKPTQPRLEFSAGTRPQPVRFEKTDEDELVGAFDDGSAGFTVGPGRTVTVEVRLALAADTVPNEITATAAVVQRHDDDGDWVGQSNDYRFRVEPEPAPTAPRPHTPHPTAPRPTGTATAKDAAPDATAKDAPIATSTATSTGVAPAAPASPDASAPFADELARTGVTTRTGAMAVTAALLVAAGALLLARKPLGRALRRPGRPRRRH
ncbi:hypothetical protein ACH4ZX_08685 [Streptomyces sp. NPDC020490]|uniref:hypothetical protein n=1 Tax=Streptomyces sp. NPDC020490 TaxID=3365078 RepID=UPI00379F41EA